MGYNREKVKNALSKEITIPGDKTGAAKTPKTKKTNKENVKKQDSVGYFRGAWRETKRVTWPTRKESWRMTFAVIAFTVAFSGFTTGLDFVLEKIVKRIFL